MSPEYYAPTTSAQLHALVRGEIHRLGTNADLNHIEVGYITDFTDIFNEVQFNGNISKWNTARGRDFSGMFEGCPFNGDISEWDMGEALDFTQMFENSEFNGNISKWNVSRAEAFNSMFSNAKFNGDVSKWDVGSAISMKSMFMNSDFSGDVSGWNVSNARNVVAMFLGAPFDGDLSAWKMHTETTGVARLLDLVSHPIPGARKHLKLPLLPVEGFRLFLDRNTMHAWLAERASKGDIDRYHWDALLRDPVAPWATPEMAQYVQTYTTLAGLVSTTKEDLPEPCIEHSAALAHTWAIAHLLHEPLALPCLNEDAQP